MKKVFTIALKLIMICFLTAKSTSATDVDTNETSTMTIYRSDNSLYTEDELQLKPSF